MKKRILCAVMIICTLITSTAFANVNPKIVTSTDREVCLDIPQGKFVDGVFMVPVRRICEMFNASCDWYGKEQMIIINTPDNITRVFLYIQSDTFKIFTFTGIISGDTQDLPLDAPLEIVNDRTLVPFEQICRALKGEVTWSEDKSLVTVTVPEKEYEQKAQISLVSDKTDVSAGDEIEVSIFVKDTDIIDGYNLSGFSAALIFDKTQFEYVSSYLVARADMGTEAVKMENVKFTDDSSKTVLLSTVPFNYGNEEVKIGKIVFRALSDNGGEIRLSNRIYTIGDDTMLVYTQNGGDAMASINRGSMLNINTEPVIFK